LQDQNLPKKIIIFLYMKISTFDLRLIFLCTYTYVLYAHVNILFILARYLLLTKNNFSLPIAIV